jgi:hypothetical protein
MAWCGTSLEPGGTLGAAWDVGSGHSGGVDRMDEVRVRARVKGRTS